MNFLSAIIDSLGRFVQRNPLTCLLILFLIVAAPQLVQGIAMFVLYFILGIIIMAVVVMLIFRWKISSMQRRMEREMKDQFQQDGNGQFRGFNSFGGFSRGFQSRGGFGSGQQYGAGQQQTQNPNEGRVTLEQTATQKPKKVADDVGDYVDFEETKDNQ